MTQEDLQTELISLFAAKAAIASAETQAQSDSAAATEAVSTATASEQAYQDAQSKGNTALEQYVSDVRAAFCAV